MIKMKTKHLILFLIAGMIGFSCQQNVQKDNTEPETTPSVSIESKMILARIYIKPGSEAEFISAAKMMIENTHKEEGCLEYMLYQDPYESTNFIFVEKYKDQAAIDFHFGTPYFAEFGDLISDMTSKDSDIQILGITKEE